MSKRLSPERIAELRSGVDRCETFHCDDVSELIGHIDALEAELDMTARRAECMEEALADLTEAKAEIARLTSELEQIAVLVAHRPDSRAAKLIPKDPPRGAGWQYCGQCWQPRDLEGAHNCPARKEKKK